MKLLTIVGIRKSGKTTTVTSLCEAIRRRGMTVGTCKTVFCPTFSIDQPGSNTARHHRAGSGLVCARAKHETSLIYPEVLPLSRVLAAYTGFDYVILEGDYEAPVPRLVAAHREKDALERRNELTLAFVGRVAADGIALPLPAFDPLTGADALLDFLEANLPETELSEALDIPLPPVPGVTEDGFCQCGCHHHEKKQSDIEVSVGGKKLTLTPEQEALIRSWTEDMV